MTSLQAMLDADIVTVAAEAFAPTFTGVGLAGETASGKVAKHLRRQFGSPRWSDPNGPVYDAVALQTILLWERACVAGRVHSGQLKLLPRGVALQAAPDPTTALREFLA
ncbi:hypothetical protein [Kribbella lupini]|uniref:Uncharacterized protein n=1 Tax=Kribbella lupini TaxID=291602 RepID=A0ABP4LTX4_9ACTN